MTITAIELARALTAEDIHAQQRTERGLRYQRFAEKVKSLSREDRRRLCRALILIRDVSPGAVHQNKLLSNLSVQYANDEYIGERLIPALSVSKRSDSYPIYTKRDRLAYPEDEFGSRGTPNEINESRSTANYSVNDYGFMNFVDEETLRNQDEVFDEMFDLIESINEGIAFRREKRLATVLTTTGNYSGNTAALSGTDRWDDASYGDPIKKIQDMLAALWQGRGRTKLKFFSGLEVYNVLARHPHIRDLFKMQKDGLATRDQIAKYFGVDEYLVGAAREDTANIGQTASYSRIWGKVFGVVRVAERPNKRIAAFGTTFRMGDDPTTTQWHDPKPGKTGGMYAKVAVSEDHKVIAGDTGYLYTTVIS